MVLVLALAGCASAPAWQAGGVNWRLERAPIAEVEYVYLDADTVHVMCKLFSGLEDPGVRVGGCAARYATRCIIYLPHNAPAAAKEHEEMHCAGWVHDFVGFRSKTAATR